MLKETKIVISLSVDRDDLQYLREIGNRYSAKNNSHAFKYLVERQRSLELQLKELKEKSTIPQQSYQDVRSKAIDNKKWDFLKKI